jgi:WD40 repeat protein
MRRVKAPSSQETVFMPQQVRIFRVFISSTFTDMKEERRILQKNVFPRLARLCEKNGARFQAVDLRWGVNEESQLNHKTLDICLKEIARCQRLSPKPNFVVLLGDKYGWQPVPARIPEEEMDSIRNVLDSEGLGLMERWYKLDTNAIPAEYILQPRVGDCVHYRAWESHETAIRQTLRHAVERLSFNSQQRLKYFASATHQEVMSGALNPGTSQDKPEEHVLALIRDTEGLPCGSSAAGFVDLVDGQPDPYSRDQLHALKDQLRGRLGGHCISFPARWKDGKTAMNDPSGLAQTIYDFLESIITEQLDASVRPDEAAHEIKLQADFKTARTEHFCGREETLRTIASYLNDYTEQRVLALLGESGSGKSSVMARAVQSANHDFHDAIVVYRFLGISSRSSDTVSLLHDICRQVAREADTTLEALAGEGREDTLYDLNGLTRALNDCLALGAEGRPILLFLDALDQLSDVDTARPLYWLPARLPAHARMVVSSLSALGTMLSTQYAVSLPTLPAEEASEILARWLQAGNRRLTDEQRSEVLRRFKPTGLPIFLKAAFEQATKWCSYTSSIVLPSTIEGVISSLMDATEEEHGRAFVQDVIGFMLSGRYQGLTEGEILEVLVATPGDKEAFIAGTHPDFRAELQDITQIPIVFWSRLFLDLEPFLTERNADGVPIVAFFHRQFNEVLKERYHSSGRRNPAGVGVVVPGTNGTYHARLAAYFKDKPLYLDAPNRDEPNVRKLVEQPFQQTRTAVIEREEEQWDAAIATLSDLGFVEAKCISGLTFPLIGDYYEVLRDLPEYQLRREDEAAQCDRAARWTRDIIQYSRSWSDRRDAIANGMVISDGEPQLPEPPVACRTSTPGEIEAECRRLIEHPSRADVCIVFREFVASQCYLLRTFAKVPWFVCHHARNFEPWGPIHDAGVTNVGGQHAPHFVRVFPGNAQVDRVPAVVRVIDTRPTQDACVNISPDGRHAISASRLGDSKFSIRVWDLETGQCVRTVAMHDMSITPLAVTMDGRHALMDVTGAWLTDGGNSVLVKVSAKALCIWDIESGQWLCTLEEHDSQAMEASMTPDGRRAVVSTTKTLQAWDTEHGRCLWEVAQPEKRVRLLRVTPDGRRAVMAGHGGMLQVWDVDSGTLLRSLEGPPVAKFDLPDVRTIRAVSTTADGRYALSADGSRTWRMWDLESGQCVKTMEVHAHAQAPRFVSITADGRRAVSVECGVGNLTVWDLESGQRLRSVAGVGASTESLCLTPDGRRAVTTHGDRTLVVWNLQGGQSAPAGELHRAQVGSVSIEPGGRYAIIGQQRGGGLQIWDLETGQWVRNGNEGVTDVVYFDATPDRARALSGGRDKYTTGHVQYLSRILNIWDLKSGHCLWSLQGHTSPITCASIARDGRLAVSGEGTLGAKGDNALRVWDLTTGRCVHTLNGHATVIRSVQMTHNAKYAVSLSADHKLCAWDLEVGTCLWTQEGTYTSGLDCLCVMPWDECVILGSGDGSIRMCNIRNGERVGSVSGHTSRVRGVSVTPNGRYLVSGGDRTLKVWDLRDGKCMAVYSAGAPIHAIAAAMPFVVCGTASGEVIILRLQGV